MMSKETAIRCEMALAKTGEMDNYAKHQLRFHRYHSDGI